MAIVKMKHLDLLAMEQDKQALLNAIQKLRCLHILQSDAQGDVFQTALSSAELPEVEDSLTRVTWAIGKLGRFNTEKKPLFADLPTVTETQAEQITFQQDELMQTVAQLEALERESGDVRGLIARLTSTREQMLPWRALRLPITEISNTRSTLAMLGTLPMSALDGFTQADASQELYLIEQVGQVRDQAYVYVLFHRAHADEMFRKLKDAGFTQVQLQGFTGTVEAYLERMDAEKKLLEERQQRITADCAALAGALKNLKQLHDILDSQRARLLAARNFAVSERTFFLRAWVPEPMTEKVEAKLKKVAPTAAIAFSDPQEGEEPPVLLYNRPAFSPFETVVSSFSLPAPFGVDPTAVMMPFFINFMGMMVSDAGYGLMMAIIAPLLIKLLKPAQGMRKMLWIITGGGIMTVFWGAMYNSWFGYAPFPSLLDPMNNALPVMGLCIGLGALHLFAGLGMAAYLNVRRGQWFSAIADQLSWFLLIVGLVLLAVVPAVGQWMALTGAALILLFAGRDKTRNPIKRLLSGLGALYAVTGWVSDLLSYIRLFGMGLATGVIGMVINILVGMVIGYGPVGLVMGVIVFAGGHLFNAGINIFGAYVHSCRLQYIEFFGKFYEDGGKPFSPLQNTSRYVYISDAETSV